MSEIKHQLHLHNQICALYGAGKAPDEIAQEVEGEVVTTTYGPEIKVGNHQFNLVKPTQDTAIAAE